MILLKQKRDIEMNCKEEFLDAIVGHELLCAAIRYSKLKYYSCDDEKTVLLPVGFTGTDSEHFLKELDFEYDNGWGSQEVFGIIWYKDGTWSDRHEYDGSEWWAYITCPEIPEKLMNN